MQVTTLELSAPIVGAKALCCANGESFEVTPIRLLFREDSDPVGPE
jgi:hypothetical protein